MRRNFVHGCTPSRTQGITTASAAKSPKSCCGTGRRGKANASGHVGQVIYNLSRSPGGLRNFFPVNIFQYARRIKNEYEDMDT